MLKPPPKRRVLFAHRYALVLLAVFGVFSLVVANVHKTRVASADTTSTVNFQARLQTASGAVVPDGYYNVEFKLYDSDEGGTALWTEDHLVSSGKGLQTINGYLSTALGSVTAFPDTIDWSQKLWLTMKVGGTSSTPSWDIEMNPRLVLTAQPYAFQAGKAAEAGQLSNVTSGNTSTLQFQGSTHGDQTFQIQDQGAAGTYNLLTQNEANNSYVQLQAGPTFTEQTGNLDISGTAIAATLQASTIDTVTATTLSIGTTNATSINLAQNTTLAAGKTITITGGTTTTRPASPTKGMLYYDTTTNHLLQYNGTKWVGSQKQAVIVAASNSSQADKDAADFVATGSNDDTTINNALDSLPTSGGTVYLEEGTYYIANSVAVPNNVTLSGTGSGTLITIPANFNSSIDAIVNTTAGGAGQGITIRDLRLDGNESNQSSCANMEGISLTSVGYATGVTSGAIVENVQSNNWCSTGFKTAASSSVIFTNDTASGNGWTGFYLYAGNRVTITSSHAQNNGAYGIYLDGSSDDVVSNNTIADTGGTNDNNGIYISDGGAGNSITANHITDSTCTSSCYAININSGSGNYLADNTYTGDGTHSATIHDEGTGTVYAGQMVSSAGNFVFRNSTDSADAFAVQNASGTSALTIDTSANQVTLNDATTINNTELVKTTNANAFVVQDASGAAALTVDTSTSTVTLNNTVVSGNLTVSGASSVAFKHGADYSATCPCNNVNFGSGALFRLTGTSTQTITGIAGGTDGRRITLVNAAGQEAVLKNSDTADSSAANIIITGTGTDFTIAAGSSVELVYDSQTSVWRIVGAVAGSVGGGSYVTLQTGSPVADAGGFMVSGTGAAATLQASNFDTQSSGTLTIGASNATGIALDKATTITATSATALKIQDAGSVALFTADTSTGTITFGTGSNTVVFTASGGLVASGTAQHTKKITLLPEYAGAVLDAGQDTSCSSANTGSLTSGYDATNRMNYYDWSSSSASAQCYDVVVQVPIPTDFDGWAASDPISLQLKKDSTGTGSYAIKVIDSTNTTDSNYNYSSPGTLSTSWGDMATSAFGNASGTHGTTSYVPGGYFTIKVRLSSTSNANVQLGNLVLTYDSKF